MELWVSGIVQGGCFSLVAIGIFITFRIYNFPDITSDGSISLGAAITGTLMVVGIPYYFALLGAAIFGGLAGYVTGLIHTKVKINALLSGILVTTSIYTINLWIMGRANIPLLTERTLFLDASDYLTSLPSRYPELIAIYSIVFVIVILLGIMFRTNFGLAMRATGDNETMLKAQGTNTDFMKIFGVAFSNALIGVSGGIVAMYQNYADISMGVGTIVYGLASVVIGEEIAKIFKKNPGIFMKIFFVVLGSALFRVMVAFAIRLGFNTEIKLITALLVLIFVGLPQLKKSEA